MMTLRFKKPVSVLSLAVLMAVSGCKAGNTPVVGKAIDSLSGMQRATEARLATAAHDAVDSGKTREALALYAPLYKKNRRDADVVLNYAQLLRKTGHADKALDVLGAYLDGGSAGGTPVLLNEYAAANIETGNFEKAQTLLDKVLGDAKARDYHADADDLLGIALDARGEHKQAEEAYRQALNSWKGDPTAVMNNLGLCLAAQGKFDDSLNVLRQALIRAPHKPEIARNIAMVSELRQSLLPTAPVSVTK